MKNEQLQEMIIWLNAQIEHSSTVINDSKKSSNFGREAQYEGMRDAFIRCLNMLNKHRVKDKMYQ
jgi:hypothetical protein